MLADKRKLPIFIHSELDDYGLDPYTFRIYAHLARRVSTNPHALKINGIAQHCQVSESAVKRGLRILLKCRLIVKESRNGYSNVYALLDKEDWLPLETALEVKAGLTDLPTQVSQNHPPGLLDPPPRSDRPPHIEGTPLVGSQREREKPRTRFDSSKDLQNPNDDFTEGKLDPKATPLEEAIMDICLYHPDTLMPFQWAEVQVVAGVLKKVRGFDIHQLERFRDFWAVFRPNYQLAIRPNYIREHWGTFVTWLANSGG